MEKLRAFRARHSRSRKPPGPERATSAANQDKAPPDRQRQSAPTLQLKVAPGSDQVQTHTQPKSTSPSANHALNLAIQNHLRDQKLSAADEQAFRQAAGVDAENLLLKVKQYDEEHRTSSFRPYYYPLTKFFNVLDKFAAIAATGAVDGVVPIFIGAARTLIGIAIDYLTFFTRLLDMLCRIGDFLAPLTEYGKARLEETLVIDTLAKVYGDVLQFCLKARRVFVDLSGARRKWVSWSVFWRNQWVSFEDEFDSIESDMEHHLDVLQHSAQALSLNAERHRRDRESKAERESFLQWISTVSYEATLAENSAKKHKDTGDWLLETEKFKKWLANSTSNLFWCHGKPGIGKSVLTANVFEHINSKFAAQKEVGIAFVSCTYKISNADNLVQLILGVIKQLCQKRSRVHPEFLKVKQDARDPSSLGDLRSLNAIAQEFDRLFLVIDALDECPQENRPKILEFILEALEELSSLKIFLASRPEVDIRNALMRVSPTSLGIEPGNVAADIASYVMSEVQALRRTSRLYLKEDALELTIIKTLTTMADGMFLWVNLQLNELCRVSRSKKDRVVQRALTKLPPGLDETYLRILKQIDAQPEYMRDLAVNCLRWVFYAQRQLTLRELQAAISFERTQKTTDADVDELDTILEACGNLLVAVHRPGREDWGDRSRVIYEVHYSAREYFTDASKPGMPGSCFMQVCNPGQANEQLLAACVTYSIASELQEGPSKALYQLRRRDERNPFLWYACRYFDRHVLLYNELCKCSARLEWQLKQLFEQVGDFYAALLQVKTMHERPDCPELPEWLSYERYEESLNMRDLIYGSQLYNIPSLRALCEHLPQSQYALHRSCDIGLVDIVARLLSDGVAINVQDGNGSTPLYHAASRGHTAIVKMLLDAGADFTLEGGQYGDALRVACYFNHINTVKLLLEAGADINAQGDRFGNALNAASTGEGNQDLVSLLLEAGADINAQGGHYGNALNTAAYFGRDETIKLLIEKGVNINARGGYYGNTLSEAAFGANTSTVKLLLEAGADINAQGGEYGNALNTAAYWGRDNIVTLLLKAGADVNAQSGEYGNALNTAAYWGRANIVRLLLEAGADVNAQSGEYGNALNTASHRGYKEIVRLLLEADADPSQMDERGNRSEEESLEGDIYDEEEEDNNGEDDDDVNKVDEEDR